MGGRPSINNQPEDNSEYRVDLYGDENGIVAPPVRHTATGASHTNTGESGIHQGAQGNSGVAVPTNTAQASGGSPARGARTNTNIGRQEADLVATASTHIASLNPNSRDSSRGSVGSVVEEIGDTALGNQHTPSTRQELPSGHHHDPAILALPVQPHLAKGPCWRCRSRCKDCTWQHPQEHCHLKWAKWPKPAVEQMQHCPCCHYHTGSHTNNCPYHKSNNCGLCGMRGGHHLSHCPNRGHRPPHPPVISGWRRLSELTPFEDEPAPSDGFDEPSGPTNEGLQSIDQSEPIDGEKDDHVSGDREDMDSEEEEDSASKARGTSAKRKPSDDKDDESPRPVTRQRQE